MADFMIKITLTKEIQICDEESIETAMKYAEEYCIPDMTYELEFEITMEEV